MKPAETDKEKEAASNDLDAVAGNAEDDIGDRIANVREHELLYGDKSLLRVYGPLISAICATPRKYRVGPYLFLMSFVLRFSHPRYDWQRRWL